MIILIRVYDAEAVGEARVHSIAYCTVVVSNLPTQELLPRWGLVLLRTWLWVKVDSTNGLPISPLSCRHRHCYEHLLLLRAAPEGGDVSPAPSAPVGGDASPSAQSHHQMDDWSSLLPKDGFAIFSSPGEHSRKPSASTLASLMLGSKRHDNRGAAGIIQAPVSPSDHGMMLELFGREMQAGWTTWGNEVLRFQQRPTPT